MGRGGTALQGRQVNELGRCALRGVSGEGRAGKRLEENPVAFLVGGAAGADPVNLGAFPVGIALISSGRHCSHSFLWLKAACSAACGSAAPARSGMGREGKNRPLARAIRLAWSPPTGRRAPGLADYTGGRFLFGNERAGSLGVPRLCGLPQGRPAGQQAMPRNRASVRW